MGEDLDLVKVEECRLICKEEECHLICRVVEVCLQICKEGECLHKEDHQAVHQASHNKGLQATCHQDKDSHHQAKSQRLETCLATTILSEEGDHPNPNTDPDPNPDRNPKPNANPHPIPAGGSRLSCAQA